jgi:xylan 1,4-beta-xylosidase
MGRPAGSLTQDQVKQLRAAGAMNPPEKVHLTGGHLQISVPEHGLALIVVKEKRP